jgi:hypothetical protein
MTRISIAAVWLLFSASQALGQTIGGPASPFSDLADIVLDDMVAFGAAAAGIGIISMGFGLITNIGIERIAQTLVAGAILAMGAAAAPDLLGAELAAVCPDLTAACPELLP